MRRLTCFTFFFLVFYSLSVAQTKESYLKFLVKRDSTVKSSLLYGSIGHTVVLPNLINRNVGYGMNLSFGLNLARFFTKKFHVGIFLQTKVKGFFEEGYYTSEFSNSISENYNQSAFTGSDTLLPSVFLSKVKTSDLGGTSVFQFGGSIHYPRKYFPLIKFYRTIVSEQIEANAYNSSIGEGQQDWISLNYYGAGGSLSFDVGNFIKRIDLDGAKLTLSFYGERYTFEDSTVEGLQLKRFIKQPFFDKFDSFYKYGISLTIGYF